MCVSMQMHSARLGSAAELIWPPFSSCTYLTSAENNFLPEQNQSALIIFPLTQNFKVAKQFICSYRTTVTYALPLTPALTLIYP